MILNSTSVCEYKINVFNLISTQFLYACNLPVLFFLHGCRNYIHLKNDFKNHLKS